jgi:predicted Zn finger-like uncharacterized protein
MEAVCCRSLTLPTLPPMPLETVTYRAYSCEMPETFKCPHCGTVYEVIHDDMIARDKDAANCQVCGKAMDRGSSNPRYELIRMPDGTNV